jgi:shikimate kinase
VDSLRGCSAWRFLDSDDEIARAANMSIAEIFERDGEAFFRRKESQVIARLLAGPPAVLSTGGGAFLMPAIAADDLAAGRFGLAQGRSGAAVGAGPPPQHPAAAARPRPAGNAAPLLEARAPIYALADLTVEAEPGYSIDATAEKVLDALKTRPDVLECS